MGGRTLGQSTLQLELTNATEEDLNDFVRIELFSATSSTHTQNNTRVQRNITVKTSRPMVPEACNRLVLTPSNYRSCSSSSRLPTAGR